MNALANALVNALVNAPNISGRLCQEGLVGAGEYSGECSCECSGEYSGECSGECSGEYSGVEGCTVNPSCLPRL